MLSASILGNGPSLKFFKNTNKFNNFVIGTNNVFYLKQFNLINQENNFYTAYDERFFKKGFPEWVNQLERFKGKIFFPSAWKNKKELKNIKNINYSFPKKNYNLVKNYSKMFSNTDNLKSSVVINSAIPLALSLNVKFINLYGCEFRYRLDVNSRLTNSSYFYNEKNYGFEHTKSTEQIWSNIQRQKLKKIKLFLAEHKVILIDKTINGNLNFI
ncbi:hypothetical protein N9S53_01485 [Candidatus Pelagibacter sp.]|nr:hypothetical protein [Candidatus Pelagibacter sp.]